MNDCTPERVCSKCHEPKPLTSEYFKPDPRYSEGFLRQCRVCRAARAKELYHDDIDKSRQTQRSKYANSREVRLADAARYRASHKEKLAADSKRKRLEHPDKVREWQRQWRENNPEYGKAYYRKNREYMRQQQHRLYRRNIEKNRAQRRISANNYRSRKLEAGEHTLQDIQLQYDAQKGRCWHCGIEVGETYHVDHLIPLSRGGSNEPRNLVISCPSCNLRKHDKLPQEFNGRLF